MFLLPHLFYPWYIYVWNCWFMFLFLICVLVCLCYIYIGDVGEDILDV
jgi:hypothetical protein